MHTSERIIDAVALRGQPLTIAPAPSTSGQRYDTYEIGQLLWRFKVFLALFVLLGTLAGAFITFSVTPIYTASSAIVFDRNDTRPYEALAVAQQQQRDKSAMDTELDIIRSRVFVGIVVDNLKLVNDPYYNTYLPPVMQADTWLRSRMSSLRELLAWLSGRSSDKSRIVSEVAQRDRAISTLLGTYTVDRTGDSLALTIKVQQPNPARGALIANAIAEQYVAWTSSLKAVATTDTVKFLRRAADELATSIANREREVAAFTENNDLTFDPKDDILRARMEQLNQQFTLARVDEASAWAKVNEIKSKLRASGEAGVGKIFTSELLTNLRTEEGRLQRLLGQLASKYGKNHPLVIDAAAELASNQRMIDDEVDRLALELQNAADVATIRVKNFEHEVALLQERIQRRNLAEIRRREMERDLLSEQKRYDTIVLRLSALDPQQEEIKATATIASFAEVPVSPTFPQPVLLIGIAFIGSVILAAIAMLILNAMDDHLHTPEEVADVLRVPTVVSFPDYRKGWSPLQNPYKALLRDGDSPFARSIRSLYLAWRTIENSAGGKAVMFLSTSPGDGKTLLSLSLAAVAKSYGLRTVVVDLNPSSKGAAKLSGVPQFNSPMELFASGDAEIEDLVVSAPNYPFLDFIISQRTLPQSAQFFDALRQHYDLIVVDAMSAEESDDAVWLSSHVDSAFVIISANRTKRRRLVELTQRLDSSQTLLVGGVVNFFGKPKARASNSGVTRLKNMTLTPKTTVLPRTDTNV